VGHKVVCAASILHDLECCALLQAALSSGVAVCVPDLLYRRELRNSCGPQLMELGLLVLKAEPHEMALANELWRANRDLCVADCLALILAGSHGGILATDDMDLAAKAVTQGVQTLSMLACLDLLEGLPKAPISALLAALPFLEERVGAQISSDELATRRARYLMR
jgi:hypothetical protein